MFLVNLFNYSSIVTACFNKITIFYRDRIIENDRKYILKGNKYIASIYLYFLSSLFMKNNYEIWSKIHNNGRNNFELIVYKDLNEFREHIAFCL